MAAMSSAFFTPLFSSFLASATISRYLSGSISLNFSAAATAVARSTLSFANACCPLTFSVRNSRILSLSAVTSGSSPSREILVGAVVGLDVFGFQRVVECAVFVGGERRFQCHSSSGGRMVDWSLP